MKKFAVIGVLLFAFLATAGMSCNVTTGDVPEIQSCDIGVVGCTAGMKNRTCKYDLPNKHYEVHNWPFEQDIVAWVAFVYTDWCYSHGYITSRHSTPVDDVSYRGAQAGFYIVNRYWWSSGCSDDMTNCLTRRQVDAYNPFDDKIESVCIGTRIYGYPGKDNSTRNITEHGCPGDSRLARRDRAGTSTRPTVTDNLRRKALAGFRLLSRSERQRVRRACASKAEGRGGYVSGNCATALSEAFDSLSEADQQKVMQLSKRASGRSGA